MSNTIYIQIQMRYEQDCTTIALRTVLVKWMGDIHVRSFIVVIMINHISSIRVLIVIVFYKKNTFIFISLRVYLYQQLVEGVSLMCDKSQYILIILSATHIQSSGDNATRCVKLTEPDGWPIEHRVWEFATAKAKACSFVLRKLYLWWQILYI